jgi:hypothetical protein
MDQAMRDALRAFAERHWDRVQAEKRRFVVERYQRGGAEAARAVAQRLRERWKALHPEAPLPSMRAADLRAHVALKRKLDRTADVFRR